MTISFSSVELPSGQFEIATAGTGDGETMLCLHGFPESWLAWEAVLEKFATGRTVVAPDQRGFNRSPKPSGIEAYQARHLAGDMFALLDKVSPDRPAILVGHDWGAAVAYLMAFMRPDRISRLIIVNGVHPWCFQNAILHDAAQRAASQYMRRLREPEAERLMSANDYERTLRMMAGFSSAEWMTPALEARYKAQWRQPGALGAMLNWYRASPIVVPEVGEAEVVAPLLAQPVEALTVRMPHLVIWGEEDTALTQACLSGLDRFCMDLTIRRVAGAGHWILHERPDTVAALVRDFLD